jgi:Rrf2 family nitric oxide-sensitive transcriptional repressor
MLSQTVEYALRAMVHLAALPPDTSANSETIAAKAKVPQGYLSKILRDLVVADLVVSQRGPNGGFSLARPADRISMLDVVNAVEPMQRIHKCPLGNPAHLKLCPLHQKIDDAMDSIERQFKSTMLADMLASGAKAAGQCRSIASPTICGKKA